MSKTRFFPDDPDGVPEQASPFVRTFRCATCFAETDLTYQWNWRQLVAAGAQLTHPRCGRCDRLMEIVGPPLT